jgi:hypothetical protein
MIVFEWKYPAKEQFPPEPKQTKDFWKCVDPGMTTLEVQDWYSTAFEMYACMLSGETSPVPVQLYYIGDREWMTETGKVLPDGHVERWDSYTEEDVDYDSLDYPLCRINISMGGDRALHSAVQGNLAGVAIGTMNMIAELADSFGKTIEETMNILYNIWEQFELKEEEDA